MAFWVYAGLELAALLGVTVVILHYYTSPSVRMPYKVVIGASWYLGFVGTLLLPMDVGQSQSTGPSAAMVTLWHVVYWTTFVLAWVVLPVLMEFYASGEYTWKGRLKTSLRANGRFYAIWAVLLIVLIVWMAVSESWSISRVLGFLIMCSNTWGIILTVFMLGYGLVEVPRTLWAWSSPDAVIQRLEFAAPRLDENLFDARCEMDDIIADTKKLHSGLPRSGDLRTFIESINRGLPTDSRTGSGQSSIKVADITMEDLSSLHRRLIAARARLKRCEYRWAELVKQSVEADVVKTGRAPVSTSQADELKWKWKLTLARPTYMTLSVIAAITSCLVIWCELTVAITGIDLSIYGLLVKAVPSVFWKQFLCILPLAYMSLCLYLPLFRLRLFDSMEMVGNRQTDTYSLCFNASYLCRLQFVLAYNFLRLLKMEGSSTAFDESVGATIKLVPLMGHDFNTYVPILMIVLSLFTFFNIYSKVLRLFGVEQFGSPRKGNDTDEETMREGRDLIQKARTRQERDVERGRSGRSGAGAPRTKFSAKKTTERSYKPPLVSPTRGTRPGSAKSGYSRLK